MSKLTKFEALQLAAILCARQKSYRLPFNAESAELFEFADAILAEDKRRETNGKQQLTRTDLRL